MKWEKISVGPFGMNCYFLYDENTLDALIIDPGDEPEHLLEVMKHLGLNAQEIIITHAHIDHILKLKEFQERTGLKTSMHPDDEEILKNVDVMARMFGLRSAGLPRIDAWLKEGDTIRFGQQEVSVLHTPGHSPGSVTLVEKEHAVVGDVIFQASIGRTDLPGASYPQLMETIRTKILTLPQNMKLLPGHGEVTTVGFEKLNNPFLQQL